MGACATKPKVKDDEGALPAPAPAPELEPEPIDDMVKNTEEVKVMEEEKKVDVNDEKKEVIEKVVVEDEKPQSLAFLLVVKEAAPVVEVPSVTKAEVKPKAEEKPKAETPKEAASVPVPGRASAGEVKKSEEKTTEKKDEKSV